MKEMESYVNCPKCGERVQVILKPYRDAIGGILKMFEDSIGVEKTDHFEGKSKCKCEMTVTATLHVTAEVNKV
jgi:hypothetical protein